MLWLPPGWEHVLQCHVWGAFGCSFVGKISLAAALGSNGCMQQPTRAKFLIFEAQCTRVQGFSIGSNGFISLAVVKGQDSSIPSAVWVSSIGFPWDKHLDVRFAEWTGHNDVNQ